MFDSRFSGVPYGSMPMAPNGPSKMEILDTAGVFDENPEALHVERLQDHRGTLENAPPGRHRWRQEFHHKIGIDVMGISAHVNGYIYI